MIELEKELEQCQATLMRIAGNELDRQRKELGLLRDALLDIGELVDGEADVDDGQPNLAMRVLVVVKLALREDLS